MPTNEHDLKPRDLHGAGDPDHPGYEVTDVNVNGVMVFIAGLFGSLFVFFLICYLMGKVINGQLQKADGSADKWHEPRSLGGEAKPTSQQKNLPNNPEMQQHELQQISSTFPEPRLEMDDGLQNTADLHTREDLFLNYYSSIPNSQTIRIPIERAMELVAQRGLPVNAHAATEPVMVGDAAPRVEAPLTNGFARTGYEIQKIEAREQQMNFQHAESMRAEK
jgi:hypothetical protein